jgi:hypothetical protein
MQNGFLFFAEEQKKKAFINPDFKCRYKPFIYFYFFSFVSTDFLARSMSMIFILTFINVELDVILGFKLTMCEN